MTPEDPLEDDLWRCDEMAEHGLVIDVHPSYLVSDEDLAIARLAFARAGAMAPALPWAGGLADQPAVTMAALLIAEDAVLKMRKTKA